MKKITILALHLGYGGIERCIATLANSLANLYDIEVVSTYKLLDTPAFNIHEKVKIKYLTSLKPNQKEFKQALKKINIIKTFKEGIKSLKILRLKKKLMINYIKTCDSNIIISTRDIHNLWLGRYGRKEILKIGWEHNYHNNNAKYINKIIKSVSHLDYFVLVSENLKEFYQDKVKCKCIYIPNALNYIPSKKSLLDNNNIISVGRLSKEKGYLDLIDVFKIVSENIKDAKLNIIGDGIEREKIEAKIKNLHLEEKIILHGFRPGSYIEKEMLNSSIYVMTSYTESFGLVLVEASSFGLPCIAFSSAEGAKEIIKDNWDGYLVEERDKEKMAKRIITLLKDKNRRIIMGDNAYKKSFKYASKNIRDEWVKLFEK